MLRTIETPWAPYSLMFSRDGTRLAIGGGACYGVGWYGVNGYGPISDRGIALAALTTGELEVLQQASLPEELHTPLTVSDVWLTSDDRHLIASSWGSGQRPGPSLVFDVDGTRLVYREALSDVPERLDVLRGRGISTGFAVEGGRVIVRRYHAHVDDVFSIAPLPGSMDPAPAPEHTRNRRVVVRDGCAITGSHGIESQLGGILRVPLGREHGPRWIEVRDTRQVTAIGLTSSGDVVSGGDAGELDLWGSDWRQRRLRAATSHTERFKDLRLAWAAYSPRSITAICAVPGEPGFVAANACGELTAWDGERLVTAQLAVRGTPRSLAAHPDGGVIAVGVKQGGFARSRSAVALLETSPLAIDPRWRTPHVLAMAHAAAEQRAPAGTLDAAPLEVLADALEEAGCSDAHLLGHLRAHDPRLRVCRVLDALLAA